jgi:hypothetical protein
MYIYIASYIIGGLVVWGGKEMIGGMSMLGMPNQADSLVSR